LLLRIYTGRTKGAADLCARRRWYGELRQLASTTFFRLERACAYWELGLASDQVESDGGGARESACEFLQNSYNLYRSIPFVDSRQSCEAVRRSLDSWGLPVPARGPLAAETLGVNSAAIDSVFDALMDYEPVLP
jgi:hypothetical protein